MYEEASVKQAGPSSKPSKVHTTDVMQSLAAGAEDGVCVFGQGARLC